MVNVTRRSDSRAIEDSHSLRRQGSEYRFMLVERNYSWLGIGSWGFDGFISDLFLVLVDEEGI